jgi:LmbE family N-acetylglucosaminyl deacetylase
MTARTALVVAAHPDDEVLGCGGTIARLSAEGWAVHVLILAEGATSRSASRDRAVHGDELSALANSAHAAAKVLGVAGLELSDFPDNRMDGVDLLDVVKRIEASIGSLSPSLVMTHNPTDVNVDHRVIHDAVIAATRSKPGSCVRELLFFETLSSTEWRPPTSMTPFAPTYYVDVTDHMARKLEALRHYESELLPFPHPRSVEAVAALATLRGATVGCAAAEAFAVGRIVR